MPDLVEAPQITAQTPLIPRKPPFRFTSLNARDYAARSAERRRTVPFKFPPVAQPEPPTVVQPVPPPAQPINDSRLILLDEQITLTREALNTGKLEPKDRAQLVRALCGLLDQQRIAKGEPLPGSRRPAPAGKTMAAAPAPARGPWVPEALPDPAPVVAAVVEVPVAPARPMGWEYDEPVANQNEVKPL